VNCTATATLYSWNRVQPDVDGRCPSRVVSLEIILEREPVASAPNSYMAAEVIRNLQQH
jgi:hypothetical protein